MEIKTLDGVEIFVLPECAVCYASEGCKSPMDLIDCPCGYAVCHPDGCENYDEVWGKKDGTA